jgi:hypothetical protein
MFSAIKISMARYLHEVYERLKYNPVVAHKSTEIPLVSVSGSQCIDFLGK